MSEKINPNSIGLEIEKDINEISTLIWEYIQAKYIKRLKGKVLEYRKESEANLSSEAQLLRSIIPFVPEQKTLLTQILDIIIYNDIIDRGMKEYDGFSYLYTDQNKENERIKKMIFKFILFYFLMTLDKNFNHLMIK